MMQRIAYVTAYDPADVHEWSGSGYYIQRCLETQGFTVDTVSQLKRNVTVVHRLKKAFYRFVRGQRFSIEREPAIAKGYARQVERRMKTLEADAIFSPGTLPVAFLERAEPIVTWTDSTFERMLDFYPGYFDLCNETIQKGHYIEKAALQRCRFAIYSSEWAAQSAVRFYGADPDKVRVVPFGANLECNRSPADIQSLASNKTGSTCRLLFAGVDWQRKGGNTAFAVAKHLNEIGLPTELWVAGCEPQITRPYPDYVKAYGFISKSTLEGRQRMNDLFSKAHFFIMPSVAEAYGLVLCEAGSFGLPCLATDVGGIPTIIKNGVNGHTFSPRATVGEYANYVVETFTNRERYLELSQTSFERYETTLSWKAAGRAIKKICDEI